MKGKLISSGSSIRLPKFLSNEPAAPARYDGTPILSGYVLPEEFSIVQNEASSSSRVKEHWYIPPDDEPPPPPPPPLLVDQRDGSLDPETVNQYFYLLVHIIRQKFLSN